MPVSDPRLSQIRRDTIAVYEANAAEWDAQRSGVFFEKGWIDRFIQALPDGAALLDVGCGSGRPIAAYLAERGFRVTGVDAAAAMVGLARARFPGGDWRVADMRSLSLGRRYGGIVAWDSFFHLDPDEQRSTLHRFTAHLQPGGALLMTIGEAPGEVTGAVNGQPVYHASLATSEYEQILDREGFESVRYRLRDRDCAEHSVLLASGYAGER